MLGFVFGNLALQQFGLSLPPWVNATIGVTGAIILAVLEFGLPIPRKPRWIDRLRKYIREHRLVAAITLAIGVVLGAAFPTSPTRSRRPRSRGLAARRPPSCGCSAHRTGSTLHSNLRTVTSSRPRPPTTAALQSTCTSTPDRPRRSRRRWRASGPTSTFAISDRARTSGSGNPVQRSTRRPLRARLPRSTRWRRHRWCWPRPTVRRWLRWAPSARVTGQRHSTRPAEPIEACYDPTHHVFNG